ncbi:hypothetical protein Tco_1130719 [Tanacetum coccineum]
MHTAQDDSLLGEEPPKSKKPKRKSNSAISFEETPSKKKPTKAKKDVPSTKKPATNPKPTKKKALVKDDRGKSLNDLLEAALSKDAQLKEATKQSKKDFHISHASGSDEGISAKPGVPNVPKYDFESDKETWGDSGEDDEDDTEDDEGNDDVDDSEGDDDDDDNDGDDGDGGDNDGNDNDDSDHGRTESDRDENPNLNQLNEEHKEEEKENVNEFSDKEDDEENEGELDDGEELYKDVNVKLRKEDVEMTDVDQGRADQHNVTQESGFEQEEEDDHVKLTTVHDTQKTEADNEIVSLMDTIVRNEEQSGQTSTLFAVPIKVIPTTIPPPQCREESQAEKQEYIDLINTLVRTIIKEEVKTQLHQILPKAVSDFATHVIERSVIESLEAVVLPKSSSQPKSTYEAVASPSEYEFTKILLDKMEESKSHLRADYNRELYDALFKSYNTDKDLFETYGEVFTLKRSRDEKDKDQGPSAGSDRGTKRRKSSKEAESQKDPRSKGRKFKKPKRPPNPDPDWNNKQQVDFRPPQTYISVTARAEKPPTSFDELMDTPINFSAFVMNRINITNLTQELLHNPEGKPYPFDLRKPLLLIPDHRVTRLKIMKRYDYDHLDEIEVRREDRQLYTFKEGDFPRLHLKDIEDMLLLLVQQKLTNLTIDEHYDLNVALRMLTRSIVIQRQVEDLQLGVESYQKKLNLTKPDTFRQDLRKRTEYTAYSDPQGVIYVDQNNKNRLMCTDELHKFSDGTLDSIRTMFVIT